MAQDTGFDFGKSLETLFGAGVKFLESWATAEVSDIDRERETWQREQDARNEAAAGKLPAWLPYAAGGGALLVGVILILAIRK